MKTAAWLGGLAFWLLLAAVGRAEFGLTTTTDYYAVDTGAGLVFEVRRTDNGSSTQSAGDLMSLIYNGVQYQNLTKGSQINSGFDYLYTGVSAVSVSAAVVNTDYIVITVVAGNLTHYYMARNGYPHIYMATYFTTEPSTLNLCRYIVRIPLTLLPNGPTPSDIHLTTSTVEADDVFALPDGETRSKHYSNMRVKDWSYIGATGTSVGVWIVRDSNEGNSGGPFYRCLLNQGATDQEITYIINYGENQTEPFRTSILNGPYTLVFTDGDPPPALDTSWVADLGLVGFVPASGRGTVTGAGITGRDTAYAYTVGFDNAQAQYWTDAAAADGSFTMTGMLPGTYTMSVYKNELAVYTASVSVTAGGVTPLGAFAITGDPSTAVPLWRIGNWDGSPAEFLNGVPVTTMHPSDIRLTPAGSFAGWTPGSYVVGTSSPATGMPCYLWKNANVSQEVQFNLTADQVVASTVRIGITTAYAGGRPNITMNSWTAVNQSASTQPDTRSMTVGSYRGNNTTYTYSVPASALVVGTNSLTIFPISGSSGSGYLSPGFSLDCIDLYQGTLQSLPVPNAPAALSATARSAQATLNWAASAGAASYTLARAAVTGGPYATVVAGLASTTYTDSALTNGTEYYYVVNATNSSGTGLNSPEASVTPTAAVSPTPTPTPTPTPRPTPTPTPTATPTPTPTATPTPTPTPTPAPSPTPVTKLSKVSISALGDKTMEEGLKKGRVRFNREDGDASKALTIYYKLEGSAINGTDYYGVNHQRLSGSVVIPAGKRHFKLRIVAADDAKLEIPKKVRLILKRSPTDKYKLGAPRKARLLILSNDKAH